MCGKPVDRQLRHQLQEKQYWAALQRNATACKIAPAGDRLRRLAQGRACKAFVLHDVLVETLDLMHETGGATALRDIKCSTPGYEFVA